MKLFAAAAIFFICACNNPKTTATVPVCNVDTAKIIAPFKMQIDTLKAQLFLANYKVEKVRYYIKICQHNASQKKFLLGWVTRAIE